jgi:GNAT superfamily N-acetyltransferase
MEIIPVHSPDHILAARKLFMEYAEYLGADLCFQGFQQELDGLPGDYAPPQGQLLLAIDSGGAEGGRAAGDRVAGDGAVGCVAMRKLAEGVCEMKRLYVQPGHRGRGLGHTLAEAIIGEARRIGYAKMRLDSLASLKEAVGLYRSLGFVEVPPYCYNPLPNVVFMERLL